MHSNDCFLRPVRRRTNGNFFLYQENLHPKVEKEGYTMKAHKSNSNRHGLYGKKILPESNYLRDTMPKLLRVELPQIASGSFLLSSTSEEVILGTSLWIPPITLTRTRTWTFTKVVVKYGQTVQTDWDSEPRLNCTEVSHLRPTKSSNKKILSREKEPPHRWTACNYLPHRSIIASFPVIIMQFAIVTACENEHILL